MKSLRLNLKTFHTIGDENLNKTNTNVNLIGESSHFLVELKISVALLYQYERHFIDIYIFKLKTQI